MYVVTIDGIVQFRASKSLKKICEMYQLSYRGALDGKSMFIKNKRVTVIYKVEQVKIKGRGKKQF
ncbi:hypothetical protein UFOVP916_55 [uncultured Caudovirales phage]|uniref:Uncharacterized protein n=1 Tax=uncultured Caudovirales phage TaxID=2100421 RepID=A0A6J5Q3T4_9CAUD|nr:hypothetical protein UFOVP827_10 [uncultured Caudovirales phage]CAB4171484.1 hypothetical protein UFOVP916_55 [uncultured Caudovirales phage]CAB4177297.1 hypothetical protein UFOVP1001_13 [uncultured Caudovirales phage]CAB4199566.1 hypothetical protein UFOVP1338_63 [uncultured Caudovirales phage]CAB4213559.1 hypothetical protein UFOVP1447_58 [uncultured Caudovirales phage]